MGVLRYGSQQYVLDLYRTGMPARKDRPARYGAGPCARGGCVCAETANRLIAAAHPYSAISALPCGSATCGGRRLRRGAPTGRRGRRKIVRSAARCQSYPCAAGPPSGQAIPERHPDGGAAAIVARGAIRPAPCREALCRTLNPSARQSRAKRASIWEACAVMSPRISATGFSSSTSPTPWPA